MDKLQWFKFNPSAWMMGKIQRCPEITQARFIRLCSLYWSKDCEMTIEDTVIEIEQEHFDVLKSRKIITTDLVKVYISFLDEQNLEIKEDKKDKSTSGIVGNLKRWHKDIYEQFLSKKISLEKAVELSKSIAPQSHTYYNPITTQSQSIADKDKNRLDLDKDKKRTEKNNIDNDKLILFFNEKRRNFPEIKTITKQREDNISELFKTYKKEHLIEVITKVNESDFLQGENKDKWIPTFDWILVPDNFIKILEGNFDNKKAIEQPKKTRNRP